MFTLPECSSPNKSVYWKNTKSKEFLPLHRQVCPRQRFHFTEFSCSTLQIETGNWIMCSQLQYSELHPAAMSLPNTFTAKSIPFHDGLAKKINSSPWNILHVSFVPHPPMLILNEPTTIATRTTSILPVAAAADVTDTVFSLLILP